MNGLETRPLGADDIDVVIALWRECEQLDDGEAVVTHADYVALAQRPSFDFARHTVAVRDAGRLVAIGLLLDERDAHAHVLPTARGRGIGAWLLRWTQEAGRAEGNRMTGQTICDDREQVAEMLLADGYTPRWESWVFEIAIEREPDPPRLPAGYSLRDLVPGSGDDRAAHGVIDEAFSEWPERTPWPFEDWRALTIGRPGFVPENIALVEHAGDVVGAAVLVEEDGSGWVDQLAVARAHRGQGLARALLLHAFGVAWRLPNRECGLSTDSRTGARGLYERVGMRVVRNYTQYAALIAQESGRWRRTTPSGCCCSR